jgi:hypothetical protein
VIRELIRNSAKEVRKAVPTTRDVYAVKLRRQTAVFCSNGLLGYVSIDADLGVLSRSQRSA